MTLLRWMRGHWFATALYVTFSLFFLVACLVSTHTYISVVNAQEDIRLADPVTGASLLSNGTLLVSFSVDILNPSKYEINLYSVNWEVTVANGTSGPGWLIPVTSRYLGSGASPVLPAKTPSTISFSAYVADPVILSKLRGYANYSSGEGHTLTLETLPYDHKFTATGWLGTFEHEYLREFYLNDLVRASLEYRTEEAL